MSDIEKTLKDIINKNALAEDVLSEFDKPRVDRFRDMLYSYLSKLDTQMYKLFRKSIIILSTVLPILAGLLGYLISKDLIPKDYHLVTWISYLAITIPLIVFARLLPEDSEVLRLEATRIKLRSEERRVGKECRL